MDNTNYLIDHIFNIIIEHSQKDPKFKLGDRIEYTPSEFINILKEHKNELLVSLEERLCNSTRDFLSHAYVKCSRCDKEMTYRSELPRNYEFLHICRARDEKKRREKGLLPMEMRGDGHHCAICTRAVEKAGDKLCPACMQRNKNLAQNMRSYVNKDNRKWDRDIERDCNEKKRHDGAC